MKMSDLIDGFGNVEGTSKDDVIIGDDNDNLINGNAGNDIIYGLGGNDILIGGAGRDVIDGGLGNDILTGDDGKTVNEDLFVFKGDASNLSNFGKDIITDFQVGVDNARLFLNNSDLISEDLSYSSGTKIDVGESSVSFNWSKIDDFDFNLLSSEFVSSVTRSKSFVSRWFRKSKWKQSSPRRFR